ncbi:hypothetical protein OBV_27980 [Oscillibacter valericigenes Sjm18-20]|nr:hypothetical protein OBV_27980 [Oscillibacter valericigenes Sjm18-20]
MSSKNFKGPHGTGFGAHCLHLLMKFIKYAKSPLVTKKKTIIMIIEYTFLMFASIP